ncbi:hypothetical protein ABZ635_22010 [Nocardiopsis sp. NPDC007018]|uniref:hypothetical protein n=1 Tax=Nocardiopsis sp. NPDC007018 TaxID=3155721 RepID=UPI0033DC2FF3
MQIKKRLTGGYRIDLTKDELVQLSKALEEHSVGHLTADPAEGKARSHVWSGVMGLAIKFPGVHTVKEEK